jgi:vacuolar-type H+-ATPase subunit E/Vma4
VTLKAIRDGYGIAENAEDLFFGESPAEQMHRIIREAKADAKKAKETATPKPLTDRQLARKEILDGLTPQERSLKDLPEAIRREAIDKILQTLPENERESYKLRLQNAGILP